MSWRSKEIMEGNSGAKNRALYKSMGYSNYDLKNPLIGVANSWNTVVPGHYNLRRVSEYVKQGILQGGGTPVEFGVIACCDGIANGHLGMRYILPSRDLIADCVETMAQAHRLDGLVLLGSCDKIVPGLLMAAGRLDIPSILVVGGPSEGGCEFDGRASDITSLSEALGMLKAGKIDFRVEKAGIVHAPMGKVSFGAEKIVQNVTAFLETIMRLKPTSSKGTYLKTMAISTTMGPGIKIDMATIKDLVK